MSRQNAILLASPWIPKWFGGGRKTRITDPVSSLRDAIEHEFLYRGVSTLEIKSLTVSPDRTSCVVTFYARPIYPSDRRLTQRPWTVLFAEQALADTAKILRTTWKKLPVLNAITLNVYRQPFPLEQRTEELIVQVHTSSETTRQTVLAWKKINPLGILEYCNVRYEMDPQFGLRGLSEKIGH
jgi:hypothetical protein